MASIRGRCERLSRALRGRSSPFEPFVAIVCPAHRAGGRLPGLHPVGPPGSRAAVWVADGTDDTPFRVPGFTVTVGGEVDPDVV